MKDTMRNYTIVVLVVLIYDIIVSTVTILFVNESTKM